MPKLVTIPVSMPLSYYRVDFGQRRLTRCDARRRARPPSWEAAVLPLNYTRIGWASNTLPKFSPSPLFWRVAAPATRGLRRAFALSRLLPGVRQISRMGRGTGSVPDEGHLLALGVVRTL